MTVSSMSPGLAQVMELLDEARARTLVLVAPLSDADLRQQHDPLMSPILWDLGHIAHFEELWLTQNLEGEIRFAEMPGMYNPFEQPRRVRGELVYPSLDECFGVMADIRNRVVAKIESIDWSSRNPLLRDYYVVHMVLQHEYQHNETILQTLQLKTGSPYPAPRLVSLPAASLVIPWGAMVRVPGGRMTVGTDDRSAAYDNERPRHSVQVMPFHIDVAPVRNGEYLAFMRDGGYERRECWSAEGWAWRTESLASSPKYWSREDGRWYDRVMDLVREVDPERPVCHVCYHEADAYARWAGKRLPTEVEWEAAATWDSSSGTARLWPWGDEALTSSLANVDQLAFDTAPVGAYPRNVSPAGCYGMVGDVWEWTSTDFHGYPGYSSFPYPEYSEVFFGCEYKVLRGGSWATRAGAIRGTFRNWDYPVRRQIFSGFRCARDD